MSCGRYPEAFFCYAQAVTAQPYNGQFWYWLGNHYGARGMLEKAEEAYFGQSILLTAARKWRCGVADSRVARDGRRSTPAAGDQSAGAGSETEGPAVVP